MPFASIYAIKARVGGSTDESGNLVLALKQLPDSLMVSTIGYETIKLPLTAASLSRLLVQLKPVTRQLNEITVTGFRDPGKALMKRVVRNRSQNDPQLVDRWTRFDYLRTEVDIENMTAGQHKSLMNTMVNVFQGILKDTSSTAALPLFFREQYRHEYHTRLPQNDAMHLVAEQNLGLQTDQIGSRLDRFNVVINAYDGVIPILKTTFVGPFSDLGLSFYSYSVPDTLKENGTEVYRLTFTPRRSNENTFEGTVWIDPDSYAILKYAMRLSPGVNLNFVREMTINQRFTFLEQGTEQAAWVLTENNVDYRLVSGLSILGIPSRADTSSKHIRIMNHSVWDHYRLNPEDITSVNFWKENKPVDPVAGFPDTFRLSPISAREKAIYVAADSLKKNAAFRRTSRVAAFITSGYWDAGRYVRIGPYSSLLSANRQEGLRIRTGFWTNEALSNEWCFWGYMAYGTRDQRLKEAFGIKYVPSRAPYRKYEVQLRNDYDAISQYDDQLDHDNLFTLALRKPLPVYMNYLRQFKVSHEYEFSPLFTGKFNYTYGSMTPTFPFRYRPRMQTDSSVSPLRTLYRSEIGFSLRYARNEKSLILNYDKIRLSTPFPVIEMHLTTSAPLNSNTYFRYAKVSLGISQEKPMPFKGSFYYNLTGGAILGKAPMLLLYVPKGNPAFVSDKYSFYCMNPFEFTSDKYLSLMTRYSLGGLIFDKIPLLNKLSLRERLIANVFWGSLSDNNRMLNRGNHYNVTNRKPYAEAGVGIDNIFNLFAVDFVWRLNYLETNHAVYQTKFGVFTGVKLQF